MGCSNDKQQTMDDEAKRQNYQAYTMRIKNLKTPNVTKNVKIVVTEDPERQGEKFHLDEASEEGEGNSKNKEKKDSFDDF